MAKKIYRYLMLLLGAICIFFLGAIIAIDKPEMWMLITIGAAALITLGYLLGCKTKGKIEDYYDSTD